MDRAETRLRTGDRCGAQLSGFPPRTGGAAEDVGHVGPLWSSSSSKALDSRSQRFWSPDPDITIADLNLDDALGERFVQLADP
jgi:hypothetical protein